MAVKEMVEMAVEVLEVVAEEVVKRLVVEKVVQEEEGVMAEKVALI